MKTTFKQIKTKTKNFADFTKKVRGFSKFYGNRILLEAIF